jgi:hypothetical protein
VDPIALIVTALAAGAIAGAEGTASTAVKDAYGGLKDLIKRYLSGRQSGEIALERHETRPDAWRGALEDELAAVNADADQKILHAARRVMELLDSEGSSAGKYRVEVSGSQGVQIGDGNVQTNTFSPPPRP